MKKSLAKKEKRILEKIKQLTSQEFEIEKLIFLGSRVYGKPLPISDYDILIITKKNLYWIEKRRISDLTLEVDLEFDIVTDIHIYSKSEIEKTILGNSPFMENIIEKGLVYG